MAGKTVESEAYLSVADLLQPIIQRDPLIVANQLVDENLISMETWQEVQAEQYTPQQKTQKIILSLEESLSKDGRLVDKLLDVLQAKRQCINKDMRRKLKKKFKRELYQYYQKQSSHHMLLCDVSS